MSPRISHYLWPGECETRGLASCSSVTLQPPALKYRPASPDGKSERSGCRAGPAVRRQHKPCLWSRARPTTAAGRTQLLSPLCLEQNPSTPHARPHPSARWCRRPSRPAACPCTSSARCLPSSGSWFCRPSSARTWCTSAAPGITDTGSGLQQGPSPAPTSPLAPTSSRASSGFAARSLVSSALPGFDGSTAGSAPSVPRKRCGGRRRQGPKRPHTARYSPSTAPHGPTQPQPRSRPHLRVEELRVGRDQLLLVRRLGHVLHLPQQPVLGQELQRHGRERRGREKKGRRRRGRGEPLAAAPPAPRAAAGT